MPKRLAGNPDLRKLRTAARWVAEGNKFFGEISAHFGITTHQLVDWRRLPEFSALVYIEQEKIRKKMTNAAEKTKV